MENGLTALVVDDEIDIREAVAFLLQSDGFTVEKASDGLSAIEILKNGKNFDIIIMDIIMPVMSGIEAAKIISSSCSTPILFLTAKSSDKDKIDAYGSGGDDFLSKPFSGVELLLRVNALLKRNKNNISAELIVDSTKRTAIKNGRDIALTDKEFDLLEFLFSHEGQVFSTSELYEQIWKEKFLPSSANSVMVHILNLRKKLENDFTNPQNIQTVWGRGYRYVK